MLLSDYGYEDSHSSGYDDRRGLKGLFLAFFDDKDAPGLGEGYGHLDDPNERLATESNAIGAMVIACAEPFCDE